MGSKKQDKAHARRQRKLYGKKWCNVYALIDSEGRVRYIGQTRCDLRTRFGFHMKNCRDWPNARLSKWLAEEKRQIVMLNSNATWDITEVLMIDRYKREGHDLLNVLRGGNDTLHALEREGLRSVNRLVRRSDEWDAIEARMGRL